ncbi:MAG: hypothetical protein ABTQ25_16755, partial [Nitrosomonas ureae]
MIWLISLKDYLKILIIGLFGFSITQNAVRADNGIWIDVDTVEQTLSVMQGDAVQAVFENVAIG